MTVSNTTNKTSAAGNGVTVDFSFSYKIFEAANLEVYDILDSTGVATLKTLNTHYTVAINTSTEGGTVTFLSAPASGHTVFIKRVLAFDQDTDIPTESNFPEEAVENRFDYITMLAIQQKEEIARAIKLVNTSSLTNITIEDPEPGKMLVVDDDGNIVNSDADFTDIQADLATVAGISANITTVAGISANVTTVAGISANVTTVAGISSAVSNVSSISAAVSTVSGISADVTTVAGIDTAVSNVSSISAAVSTVSGISADVTAVAAIDTDVTTVAGISANVTTVAGISANVTTVAGIDTEVTTVAGISSAVSNVSSISSAVSTVSGISANVTTVAGISADVTTVAGMQTNIASVIANLTDIQNAASFGFPTLASGDEYKMLQIKADRTGYNAVEAISRRNALINGDFNIWQRGTSFVSIADSTYSADRWKYFKSTTGAVHDVSRSTDVPSVASAGRLFNYSVLVDCQTADASVAAADYVALTQPIEGYNWLPLAQKAIVLSFWVKATKTGTYCVSLQNSGVDRSYIGEYTVNVADTWEFKTVTISASPSAGTWDYTTGVGCYLNFVLMCGSDLQGAAGSWLSAQKNATSNQVNACDSTSNNFRICGVQLEVGSLPTTFEQRGITSEIALCQRYYVKDSTSELYAEGNSVGASNGVLYASIDMSVEMRAAPTVGLPTFTLSNTGAVAAAAASTRRVTLSSLATASGRYFFSKASGSLTLDSEL